MSVQSDRLERDILILFKRACRQSRLDIAEHLLRALEAADEMRVSGTVEGIRDPLPEAYLFVAPDR
ncbi:hypothetical protein [Sinorhizobium medicae]|uniref:Uncharacterized protein n=1 Tax=Sinorhizobium medicae TaxID=110321 RepID=A0A508WQS0_9HYPH|nr:hypothetical protein [Sinorhizobium medicae]MDX0524789.1 hypothetical protein [Sinorhizobium medicae]VTZ59865.1 conserved hypothetical protein [Sinorhizobium medicae]